MNLVSIGLAGVLGLLSTQDPRPVPPRFENQNPLPGLPGVMLDRRLHGNGVANPLARAKGWQARILWIDATANIERYNTAEKIQTLVAKIAESGFNTIILDVKPISGHVIFKSEFAPKLEEWRGRKLPLDFDPVPLFCDASKAKKVQLFLSLNAFSEGHNLMQTGPGFANKQWQSVFYEPKIFLEIGFRKLPVASQGEPKPAEEALSVFLTQESLNAAPQDGFAISMNAAGKFIDGFELFPQGSKPTVPKGGSVVLGRGKMATALRDATFGASQVQFSVEPDLIPSSQKPKDQSPMMSNPASKEVLQRNAQIIKEIATKYEIDGIVYDDRLRFAGIHADFSDDFRTLFEHWLGRKLNRWPEDVYQITFTPGFIKGLKPGPEYENWLIFRSLLMKKYVAAIGDLLKSVRPSAQFGVYAGSWYGEYSAFGSNYGADDLDAGFWFLTPEYRQTGFASQIDFLITGCYYPSATIFEAMSVGKGVGQCIEAAAALTNSVANDATWAYAGISLEQFANNPAGLANALQAATGSTQGVMIFDLSHNIEPMWRVFRQAFQSPATSPNRSQLNLVELRRRKALAKSAAQKGGPNGITKSRTPIISTGQPGAGH